MDQEGLGPRRSSCFSFPRWVLVHKSSQVETPPVALHHEILQSVSNHCVC
jgi:hypothetical protein